MLAYRIYNPAHPGTMILEDLPQVGAQGLKPSGSRIRAGRRSVFMKDQWWRLYVDFVHAR